jgi:hypothetical protein
MIKQAYLQGAADALATFGLKTAEQMALPGVPMTHTTAPEVPLVTKAKSFGLNQADAAKSLLANVRGGFGGQHNPEVIQGPVPEANAAVARGNQRQQALGNLKTLAPSMALTAAGLYGAHKLLGRGRQQEEEARRRRMAGF